MLHTKTLTGKQKVFSLVLILTLLICGSVAAFAIQSPVVVEDETTPLHEEAQASDAATSQMLPSTKDNQEDTTVSTSAGEALEPDKITDQTIPTVQPEDVIDQDESEKNIGGEENGQTIPEKYQNALRGNVELILARGGTLLPDDDPQSYMQCNGVFYKEFAARGSTEDTIYMMTEYEVGNWELLSPSKQKLASETLIDGDYPKNSNGESYGATTLAGYVGYSPDLVSARGTQGESGYIRDSEIETLPDLPEQDCPHEFMIPLYDSEGVVIGEFSVSCGGHHDKTMTLEEAREAAMNGSAN